MIFVGIDVAKEKHDCFMINSEGIILADVFTIPNNRQGFHALLSKLKTCCTCEDRVAVGLEATGHYSYNILGFLLDNNLTVYVLNSLHTNLYRKSAVSGKQRRIGSMPKQSQPCFLILI